MKRLLPFAIEVAIAIALIFAVGAIALFAQEESTIVNVALKITSAVSTNIVAGDNRQGCDLCHQMSSGGVVITIFHPPHGAVTWKEATEKWIITNIVRNITYSFTIDGRYQEVKENFLVGSTTNRWKLVEQWTAQ